MHANALGIALHPVVLSLSPAGCDVTQWSTCATMKLTVDQVIEIRRLHRSGMKQAYLAMKFDVSQQHIARVINKERWGKKLQLEQDRATHKKILDAIAARDITDVQPKG